MIRKENKIKIQKMNYNLNRFLTAQAQDYPIALREIQNGSKQSH